MSGLHAAGPGQRAPGRPLRRPARSMARPMSLAWKKHRMRCVNPGCPKRSWVLEDHRIAAKQCLLTTRAAKWATRQVGGGRTVSEVADELACDWHTVNDAVMHLWRGAARGRSQADEQDLGHRPRRDLLRAPRHQGAHRTTRPRWPTSSTTRSSTSCRSRTFTDVAAWLDKQPKGWKERIRFGALDMSSHLCGGLFGRVAQSDPGRRPLPRRSRLANRTPRRRAPPSADRTDRPPRPTRRSALSGPAGPALGRRAASTSAPPSACGHCSSWAIPTPRWPSPIASKSACVTSIGPVTPRRPARCSKSSSATARKRAMPPEVQKLGRTIKHLVRQDRQLPPGPGHERSHRGAQQPDQADQTHRLRVPQLRELPDPCPALRRQAELAGAGLDRRPVRGATPPDSDEPF